MTPRLLRRVSGLKTRRWQDYFSSVAKDCILCDIRDRVLHYWGSDGFYRIYPTSVPLTEEMTRRGRTTITLKRPDPDWRPTPAMLSRNPALPGYVPPGPDNPLGIRALNLGWPSYRIHGTNDIRKIGRQSSSGCIGLFNEHILEVYDRAQIGTPVLLIMTGARSSPRLRGPRARVRRAGCPAARHRGRTTPSRRDAHVPRRPRIRWCCHNDNTCDLLEGAAFAD